MPRTGLDDETIERLLAGENLPGLESVVAFASAARRMPADAPRPPPALSALFQAGIPTEPVTAPAVAPIHRPRRKPRTMITAVLAKLATAGLVAKTGIAAGAITLTATTAAATGNLPVAQAEVADAVERVGISIPGGKSQAARDAIANSEPGPGRGKAVSEAVRSDRAGAGADNAEAGKARAEAGKANAEAGKANAEAGKAKADAARANAGADSAPEETPAPVATPNEGGTGTAGTASSGASDAGTGTAGEQTPAAEDGSDNAEERRPGTPTAEDNPGSSRRP